MSSTFQKTHFMFIQQQWAVTKEQTKQKIITKKP